MTRPISVRRRKLLAAAAVSGPLAGCARSPAFNVLGSYFPGWIASMLVSVLLTVGLRWFAKRSGLERRLPMLPLFYTALAVLLASALWLIGFE